jgi:hypothetical protein
MRHPMIQNQTKTISKELKHGRADRQEKSQPTKNQPKRTALKAQHLQGGREGNPGKPL